MQSEALTFEPTVKALASKIANLEPGALAELRRPPAPEGAVAFWRLWHTMHLPYSNAPWEEVVRIIAILTPTGRSEGKQSAHNANRSFGRALFESGVSDLRFSRLLAATPDERRRTLVRLARMLDRSGERFNLVPLARMVLFDQVDDVKRQVAKEYYGAEANPNPSQKETQDA